MFERLFENGAMADDDLSKCVMSATGELARRWRSRDGDSEIAFQVGSF